MRIPWHTSSELLERSIMNSSVLMLGLVAASALWAQPPVKVPVVVELFTSESCSSCPPADNVLSRLERDQPIAGVEVIALGEHVDYWDNLGWKDRFSSPLFTARQQDYGEALHLQSVYTPQIVVNGTTEALGSDENAAAHAIGSFARTPRAAVSMRMTGIDLVGFEVRQLPPATRIADLFLAVTESNIESAVQQGENAGRRLRHAPVVRTLTSLGQLDTRKSGAYSATARLMLNPSWNRANLRLVLFVEDHNNRHILGAATLKP
jgi:hypothetical protein